MGAVLGYIPCLRHLDYVNLIKGNCNVFIYVMPMPYYFKSRLNVKDDDTWPFMLVVHIISCRPVSQYTVYGVIGVTWFLGHAEQHALPRIVVPRIVVPP